VILRSGELRVVVAHVWSWRRIGDELWLRVFNDVVYVRRDAARVEAALIEQLGPLFETDGSWSIPSGKPIGPKAPALGGQRRSETEGT
jgi:hypothetical protein